MDTWQMYLSSREKMVFLKKVMLKLLDVCREKPKNLTPILHYLLNSDSGD
jgi:hypothetical protein